jgi:hypothetical protein
MKESGPVHNGWIRLWIIYFLDETVFLFLEAIELCSVRHNRGSKETIHSYEHPRTKTIHHSRPKLGRGN